MPETPVFIGDSVLMVAKCRESVYLIDVSKNPKMAHEVAHESGGTWPTNVDHEILPPHRPSQ